MKRQVTSGHCSCTLLGYLAELRHLVDSTSTWFNIAAVEIQDHASSATAMPFTSVNHLGCGEKFGTSTVHMQEGWRQALVTKASIFSGRRLKQVHFPAASEGGSLSA